MAKILGTASESGLLEVGRSLAWWLLVAAGLAEIGWAIGLKYSDGFSRLWPTLWTVSAMVVSFVLLAFAMKAIPVGTAYAVWTGIGAAGTAALGMILFDESRQLTRILCLLLTVLGIVGLMLVSRQTPS